MAGPVKAFIKSEDGSRIDCMFNPTQLSVTKSNTWNDKQSDGTDAPDLIFTRGEASTFSFSKLTLDTTGTGKDVTKQTDKLMDLMKVREDKGRPPWVQFQWGSITSEQSVIENISIDFTYFSTEGTPLRAEVELSLKQFKNEAKRPPQNPTSGTPEPHSVHMVVQGENLHSIAQKYYGDWSGWREIAVINQILDPLGLQPGTVLRIPKRRARRRG